MFILTFILRLNILDQDFFRPLLTSAFMRVLPGDFEPLLDNFVNEIFGLVTVTRKQSLSMYLGTAIVALWVSGKGIMALMFGLNSVNGKTESRNYVIVRLQSSVYALIVTVMVFIGGIVMMFGNNIQHVLMSSFSDRIAPIVGVLVNYHSQVTIFGLVVLFVVIYHFLPDSHIGWFSCLSGAVFTAVTWSILSLVFSLYMKRATRGNMIYGSLTTFIMILMWLYFCMYILFIGAEICCYQENPAAFEYTTIEEFVNSIPLLKKIMKFFTMWRLSSYIKQCLRRDGIWLNTCWDVDPSLYPRKHGRKNILLDYLKKWLFYGFYLVRMDQNEIEKHNGEEEVMVREMDHMEEEIGLLVRKKIRDGAAAGALSATLLFRSRLSGTKLENQVDDYLEKRKNRTRNERRLSEEQKQGFIVMLLIGLILVCLLFQ